jgi:glutathione S-transferase
MKARLYQFASSPFCAKVRKIFDYKGIEYETVEVDYLERKELLLVSRQLMVPAAALDTGEVITDSERIALRLEELSPEPTIFPLNWRGIHLALARYFDTEFEDVIFRAALPDELAHYASQGCDREAFYRLIRERKYGAGFCDQMIAEHERNWRRMCELLQPLDQSLSDRAFLLGRIGYADFALYGQLSYLAFSGAFKIPAEYERLRAFFLRMDRISATLEPNG